MTKYDAIVVGAGHNGLTNAAYLARSGLKVLVVERMPWIGGAAVSREIEKGWIYSNCSYVCSLLRPELFRDLELARHGLQVVPYGGGVSITSNGDILGNYTDEQVQRREFARHNPRDADAYHRYSTDVMRQCKFIRPLLLRSPPDPTSFKPRDLKEMLFLGRELNKFGEQFIYDTLRFYSMSIADFLNEYFESDAIKCHLSGSGIIGSAMGVYSPGTAYVLLHHYMGDVDGSIGAWGFARGGMGAVSKAIANSFKSFGGEIVTDAPVARVIVKGGRVAGVATENGTEYHADIVVSNLDPRRTFTKIFDPRDLPPAIVEKAKNWKIRGSSGKLNIALDGLPEFPALGKNNPLAYGDMHFLDSLEKMERAYDDWKNGTWSKEPYLDLLIPSMTDPTMAPPGKHFMSVFVQYVPPFIHGREWTDADREGFKNTVLDQIGRYSPNFKSLVRHVECRTPRELENEVGLTEGNIFQGELTMDQLLFNRPFPGYAQYRGPVKGFYMCGSGTHPGGGVMAAPGANAAREILMDLRRPNIVPEGWRDDERNRIVIVGGGHNGLVCAAYLARAGREVVVVEAAAQVGGAAVTREFAKGFRASGCSHLSYLLDAGIARELNLASHGLKWARTGLKTVALAAAGDHLVIDGGRVESGRLSESDRAALAAYHAQMLRFARVLAKQHNRQAPRLGGGGRSDLIGAAKLGLDIRLMGREPMREFLRIAGINIFDVLEEKFDSPLLKGALALDAVLGANLGPRSNNSVLVLLHRLSGLANGNDGLSLPEGGMGAISEAMAAAARAGGVTIRTGSAVARITLDGDKVSGVELENGEKIAAGTVVSNADPARTLLSLLGARHLETGFVHRVRHFRSKGMAAKLHLALDALPTFARLPAELTGERLVISPDLVYLEHAFDHAKYGQCSPDPALEITIPSVHDKTLAPAGKHVLSAIVQYAPHDPRASGDGPRRELLEHTLGVLERHAPGLRRQIVGSELLLPADIEREYRITGGHWHHGEVALDQFMMMRPVPGAAQYAMPVAGLFLCGAGCHPGGGVMGSAGRNAANAVLATERAA